MICSLDAWGLFKSAMSLSKTPRKKRLAWYKNLGCLVNRSTGQQVNTQSLDHARHGFRHVGFYESLEFFFHDL